MEAEIVFLRRPYLIPKIDYMNYELCYYSSRLKERCPEGVEIYISYRVRGSPFYYVPRPTEKMDRGEAEVIFLVDL